MFKRIKIFTTDNEGIIGKSRNIGLKNSNGEWLSFLDSDDWWEPKKLEEIFKIINHSYKRTKNFEIESNLIMKVFEKKSHFF